MTHDEQAYKRTRAETDPWMRVMQTHCVRCGAVVADPERHDAWHGAMDK